MSPHGLGVWLVVVGVVSVVDGGGSVSCGCLLRGCAVVTSPEDCFLSPDGLSWCSMAAWFVCDGVHVWIPVMDREWVVAVDDLPVDGEAVVV